MKQQFVTTDSQQFGRVSAAASNPFFKSAAVPTSLAAFSRFHIIVRDASVPLAVPLQIDDLQPDEE